MLIFWCLQTARTRKQILFGLQWWGETWTENNECVSHTHGIHFGAEEEWETETLPRWISNRCCRTHTYFWAIFYLLTFCSAANHRVLFYLFGICDVSCYLCLCFVDSRFSRIKMKVFRWSSFSVLFSFSLSLSRFRNASILVRYQVENSQSA